MRQAKHRCNPTYMNGMLPALMKEADAAPGSLSKVLPLSRNIDALYDVMVHVVEAARVVAPADQVGELQQAMADLEKARVAFGDQLQQTADAQEKHISDLRTTVQTQAASLKAAATAPPAPKCPAPPTPAKKKKVAPKSTTSKPAAGTPATTPAATSTNPRLEAAVGVQDSNLIKMPVAAHPRRETCD